MRVDRQKSKVYRWEDVVVSPHDTMAIFFHQVEAIVNYIWEREGLQYPPMVAPISKKSRHVGYGSRLKVQFQPITYTWIVLHELSHSLTSTCDGRSNRHGALYMGIYIQLLHRYLHLDFAELVKSAEAYGLKVKPDAKPVF